ncbi:MAG: cytochrome c oxidase assembly protein [Candidatus Eisenbacteria bacterium]
MPGHAAPAAKQPAVTPGSWDWSFIPGTKTQAPELAPFDPRIWENHNSVLIGTVVLAALYLWAVGPLRRKKGWAPKFPVGRAVTFFVGLTVMLLALNGPLHDLSDYYLFSVHMVQHLMLTQVMAPLIILGLPAWLVGAIVSRPGMARAAKFWGSPLIGGGLYISSLVFWHLIPFYDLMMRNHNIHIATHLMFMITAVMAWWPVCCALPEAGRIREPAKMLYLFLLGVPMQVLAAVISLSDRVLYPWYATAPRTWGLTPLDDQQWGGLIMWVPGGLGLWLAITVVWLVWAKQNEPGRGRRVGDLSPEGEAGGDEEPPLTLPRIP